VKKKILGIICMFQFGSLSSIMYSRLVKKFSAVICILSFSFLMSWYALATLSMQPPATKVPEEPIHGPTILGLEKVKK
jgi:hypothetical protein